MKYSKTCIIFDFDFTLTEKSLDDTLNHNKISTGERIVTRSDQDKNAFVNDLFGGYHRLYILKKFLRNVFNKHIDLHISCHNRLKDIIFALETADLLQYFKTIHSVVDKTIQQNFLIVHHVYYPYNKDRFVFDTLHQDYTNVIYIDDNQSYHHMLKSLLDNCIEHATYDIGRIQIDDVAKKYTFIKTLKQKGDGMFNLELRILNNLLCKDSLNSLRS